MTNPDRKRAYDREVKWLRDHKLWRECEGVWPYKAMIDFERDVLTARSYWLLDVYEWRDRRVA